MSLSTSLVDVEGKTDCEVGSSGRRLWSCARFVVWSWIEGTPVTEGADVSCWTSVGFGGANPPVMPILVSLDIKCYCCGSPC